jgi:hypothetical protein
MADKPPIKCPGFRPIEPDSALKTPGELFYSWVGAAPLAIFAAYNRTCFREYVPTHVDSADLALELPTGPLKTAVGLIIAE